MTKTVEFYFDFGSPAAYLAATQLPHIAADTGATIEWKPMLLGGVFQATGNHSPAEIKPKGPYMTADLARYAKRYGVPYAHNPHFPINTLLLMRAATGIQAQQPDRFAEFVKAVFDAIWVDSKNMNDPAVVGQVLQAAGFDAAEVLGLANAQDTKDKLKATTQEAVERGVFGAPTMFVGKDMFWGQDRLDFVREYLAA